MSSTLSSTDFVVVDKFDAYNAKNAVRLTVPEDVVIFIRDGDDALMDKFVKENTVWCDGDVEKAEDYADDDRNDFVFSFKNVERAVSRISDDFGKGINFTILDAKPFDTYNHCMLCSEGYSRECKCYNVVFWTSL